MGHPSDNCAVREHLVAYLHDEVSLDELKSRLVFLTWNRGEPCDEEDDHRDHRGHGSKDDGLKKEYASR